MQEVNTSSGSMVMGREVPPWAKAELTEWGRGGGSFWHQEGLHCGSRMDEALASFWGPARPHEQRGRLGLPGATGPPHLGRMPALCSSVLCSDVVHKQGHELGAEGMI